MSKKIVLFGVIGFLLAGVVAAGVFFLYPYPPNEPPKADDVGSTPQGIAEVVSANNNFTFDLYTKLGKTEDGNIFYSPYSISAALAMTYEGAKEQTADEIKSVFHFPEASALRPNFAAIYNTINQGSQDYALSTGNALWTQKTFPFLEEYKTLVENYYGGKAADLDFVNETEKSRQTINSFIAAQTNNKITELIPQGLLNTMTRLVLTNAIYFKGTWKWEFDKSKTYQEAFNVTPTDVVQTQMMHMNPTKTTFNYVKTNDLQVLEMPYKGDNLSMFILLPTTDIGSIEPSLTAQKLEEYKLQLEPTNMDLIALPRFEFKTSYSLNDPLKELGMPTAFSSSADFSGMDGNRDLFIDFVLHKAYVNVDEQGTEAAAATAVGMALTAAPSLPQNVFRADHPFVFVIQEKQTGNILFLGRVTDPTK